MTAARTLTDAGLDDVEWGGWCPVQGTGYIDGCFFYFRARGGRWRLEIGRRGKRAAGRCPRDPEWFFGADYGAFPDAGWMPDDHVRWCLIVAVAVWRARGGVNAAPCSVELRTPFVPGGFDGFDGWTLPGGAS